MCVNAADMVLCDFALSWSPDDSSLWFQTCRNIQCDVIQISQALRFYAILRCHGLLMTVPCGSKLVGIFSVT